MKGRLSFNTLLIVYSVVLLVALATWVVPGGEYRREIKDGKTLVVPGSFVYGEGRRAPARYSLRRSGGSSRLRTSSHFCSSSADRSW